MERNIYEKKLLQVQAEVNKIIKGKQDIVEKILAAIISGGHILMEDMPGVGKTTLATTFAKALSMDYNRVQFTPDVLPSDILGFSMYNSKTQEFQYRPGSVFCNIFLADEINRTSPKTQSALLEAMEENKVTVEGVTRALPDPFVVIATENPSGSSGTQMLPESQLDRFMICVSMGYPSHEDAVAILKGEQERKTYNVQGIMTEEDLRNIRRLTDNIFVDDKIYEYIVNLVEETRNNNVFEMGASPRGSIALLRMSRAMAVLEGRDFVTREDVQKVAKDVLGHRIRLSSRGRAEGLTSDDAMDLLLHKVRLF